MNDRDKELIESLSTTHPELHRLRSKHEEYEERLDALKRKRWRAPGEEAEERKLKRLKLAGRDRMASIVAEHKRSEAS